MEKDPLSPNNSHGLDLLDHLPISAFVISADMTVVFWNRWVEEMTQLKRENLLGKKITDTYPHLKELKYYERIEPIFRGAPPTVFSSLLHKHVIPVPLKNGGYRVHNTTVTPIPSPDGGVYALFAIQDVTDLTYRINEARTMRDHALRAKEEAESATTLKDKFVSLVAHDLRSPLASIIGYLMLLESDAAEPPLPGQREVLGRLLEIGGHMVNVIDEILNLSKLKSGKLVPHPKFVDASEIVATNVANLSLLAEKKGITVISEIKRGIRLYADPALAGEVVGNLLSNAIKFCRKGDTIRIFAPRGANTTIAVEDTGIGIPKERIAGMFRYDMKTSTPGTAQEKGTGLGLPFCHDIMNSHGGSLRVESEAGKGSTFYAEFPAVRPVVAVADDSPVHRQQIAALLEKLDVEIIEAGNGREALEIISTVKPNLVISDIFMPELDGFGLLEKIRKNPATASIPFMMISSEKNAEVNEKVIRSGGDDFISKANMAEDFIPRVRKFIV